MKVFNEPHGSIKEIIGYAESHKEICFILYSWFQKLNSGSCSHVQENGSQGLNMDRSVIYNVWSGQKCDSNLSVGYDSEHMALSGRWTYR